jgi:hypothetical protein
MQRSFTPDNLLSLAPLAKLKYYILCAICTVHKLFKEVRDGDDDDDAAVRLPILVGAASVNVRLQFCSHQPTVTRLLLVLITHAMDTARS